MNYYYAVTRLGCGVRKAANLEAAYQVFLREAGTCSGVSCLHLATDEEIAWVRAMGGFVPT